LVVAGRAHVIEEEHLPDFRPFDVDGLVITSHVDQIWLESQRRWLAAFLAAGGRLFFNGHVETAFVDGMGRYRALADRRVEAFRVTRTSPHLIWDGYNGDELTFRKGVAGFYGRGHNALPAGAVPINTLDAGHEAAPVDWEWLPPGGGRIISHAGNDLWLTFEAAERNAELVDRMVTWLEAGS
jgi:hypothetical protein